LLIYLISGTVLNDLVRRVLDEDLENSIINNSAHFKSLIFNYLFIHLFFIFNQK